MERIGVMAAISIYIDVLNFNTDKLKINKLKYKEIINRIQMVMTIKISYV
ncbi:hypothetical protein [Maledivibacter halophilus]|nr:hypothetical protein [Maledivibacter halophilus]